MAINAGNSFRTRDKLNVGAQSFDIHRLEFLEKQGVADLATMREAVQRMGGSPKRINPLFPAELVIDHSVQVDNFGSVNAFGLNAELEFQRNVERYAFLRWGQTAFQNFKVVPPDTGICHQVNLEYLARVVCAMPYGNRFEAYPDAVVGTDSHTTMVNSLGVFGWGVGGIEAEAAMLEPNTPRELTIVVCESVPTTES